jgi:hypothetical protein
MSLLVTNSRNMDVYLSDSSGVFQTDGGPFTRLHVINGNVPNRQITYLDKFDRCVGHMDAVEFSFKSARWDPNLVDNTSSQVGFFVNPEDNSPNTPYFVSAYDPSTTAQRLYTIGAGNIFVELSMADPEVVVDSNPFPKFSRNEAFDFSFAGADEFSFSTLGGARSGSWPWWRTWSFTSRPRHRKNSLSSPSSKSARARPRPAASLGCIGWSPTNSGAVRSSARPAWNSCQCNSPRTTRARPTSPRAS